MFSKNFCGVTKIPRICFSAPAAKPCLRVCGQTGADGRSGAAAGSGDEGGQLLELLRKTQGKLRITK